MYADKVTGSMQRALDEMERRREVQVAYNIEHNVKPVGIQKDISDIMEGAYSNAASKSRGNKQVAEKQAAYQRMSEGELLKEVTRLEKTMYKHARDLEFEQAAQVRDQIDEIRSRFMNLSKVASGKA